MTDASQGSPTGDAGERRLVYCRCAYAKIVPQAVNDDVLRRLGASGRDFEAVPDLCELAAKKDPSLERFADDGSLELVACYPRAVRWLLHGAGHQLHPDAKVHNMRTESGEAIAKTLGLED